MILVQRRAVLGAAATLPAALAARKLAAAPMGRVDALTPPGDAVPAITWQTASGQTKALTDYAGGGVVLNFWATWCAPCVREMPTLAALSRLLDATAVSVLPLSSDRGGAEVVARYFATEHIEGLPILLDPRGAAAHALGTRGLPTTVLIDSQGRERGRFEGAADWASPAAVAAVKALAPG